MPRCSAEERHRIARQGTVCVLALQMLSLRLMLRPLEAGPVKKHPGLDSFSKRLEVARIAEAAVLHCCDRLHY